MTLSQEFLRAAAGDEEAALAHMLLSAFGISLQECMDIVEKAIANKDSKIIVMMMGAGVQVRGNIVFVGREYANVRSVYPKLVIEGDRETKDIFNYSALHICGHILAHVTSNSLGVKILKKGGDCILGEYELSTQAGEINKEIASSWTAEDKSNFGSWLEAMSGDDQAVVDNIVANFSVLNARFTAKLTHPTGGGQLASAPASQPKASAATNPLPSPSSKT